MQRTWNYILYSTWKIYTKITEVLIESPLINIIRRIQFLRDRWNKGEREYNRIVKSRNLGVNVLFAYYSMLTTTSIIYSIVLLYVCHFFQVEVGEKLYYYFIAVVILSYLTNEMLSWRKDVYLKYFTEFDKTNKKTLIYLPAALFHLGVAVFAVLSIHWTNGFNL